MNISEHDVLAYMAFLRQHRTNLIRHLNKEVKRRADVVGIFPNESSIMRLICALRAERAVAELKPLHDGRGIRPDRQRGDRSHSQHNHESCLIMPSGHLRNYTSLTDVTDLLGIFNLQSRSFARGQRRSL